MTNKLSTRIIEFLDKYASISPNWDKNDEDSPKYTGPDPSLLLAAAELIEQGIKPDWVWSEWGSGCYKPYSSKEGQKEHNEILEAIKNYKSC